MNINTKNYIDLLKYNLNGVTVFNEDEIQSEINIYEDSIKNWENYSGVPNLLGWRHPVFQYPNIHPIHKKIVDTISFLDVKNVCDVGAGAGSVVKYVYNSNNKLNLTCIEGYDVHLSQMKENFDQSSPIIPPQINVPATIIKGIGQDLPLDDNSQDLIYTCTVMMHIPFLLAIKTAMEIARVSNKYVLHLERKDGNVVIGNQKSKLNFLQIDYKKLYENQGFKTINYYEFPYPEAEQHTCVYYLGEKITVK
jgi:ubiquinone/menaquinone biosynthesis C-methylase UbiE